jgi:hypothetical protein
MTTISNSDLKPRANRFSIQTPLRYRISGETDWSVGVTTNISRSGVLFQAKRELEPNMQIEMQIHFRGQITGSGPVNLISRGLVVRTEAARDGKWRCGVAGSIIKHQLVAE